MNINKLKLLSGTFCVVLLFPNVSQAYLSTAKSAARLTPDTVLFTVKYKFGFLNRELYMPIGAVRGLSATDKSPYLGYTIFDKDHATTSIGSSVGLVLTSDEDIEIKNGQYYLPKSKGAEFTFITLLTIPTEQRATDLDLSLQVTRLPFTLIEDGEALNARLNPSELQYYLTPDVKLPAAASQ